MVAPEDGDGLLLRGEAEFARMRTLAALRLMGGKAAASAAPETDDYDQFLTDARMHLPRPLPAVVPCPSTEHRTVGNSIRPPALLARRKAGACAQKHLGTWAVPS